MSHRVTKCIEMGHVINIGSRYEIAFYKSQSLLELTVTN